MKSNAMRTLAAVVVAACLTGCGEEVGDGQKPVIDTSSAPAPTTSQSAGGGIPSSGGTAKKKPDPVGAMSPIIPRG